MEKLLEGEKSVWSVFVDNVIKINEAADCFGVRVFSVYAIELPSPPKEPSLLIKMVSSQEG